MSDNATTSTPTGAKVGSNIDQIAELLLESEPEQDTPPVEARKKQPVTEETNNEPSEEISNEKTDEEGPGEEKLSDEEALTEDEVTWSKVLGVDEKNLVLDDNGDFAAVKVKVDGKEAEVKLPDLIAGYQTNKYNTQKAQAIAEEAKQFVALKDQVVQAYTSKLDSVNKLTAYLEQSFLREFQDVNWDALRVQNPGEYAAAVQDYGIRQSEIQKIKDAVEQEKTFEVQSMTQAQQQQIQKRTEEEIASALEKNPTWRDPAVLKKDVEELKDFVGEAYGFTPEEFETIQDHRLLELVKDAMRYKKNTQIATLKLQKPVPKFQSPQTRKAKPVSKLERLTKQAKAANGYRKTELQTDAIAELLNGI